MLLPVSSMLQLFMQMHVMHALWHGVNTFCSCVPYLQGGDLEALQMAEGNRHWALSIQMNTWSLVIS